MKLTSTTLQLLGGIAALSTVTAAADHPKPAAPAPVPKNKAEAFKQIELQFLFAIADKNKDGVISLPEFKAAYAEMEKRILAANPRRPKRRPGFDPCVACGLG